jgi:hypothetical protein
VLPASTVDAVDWGSPASHPGTIECTR